MAATTPAARIAARRRREWDFAMFDRVRARILAEQVLGGGDGDKDAADADLGLDGEDAGAPALLSDAELSEMLLLATRGAGELDVAGLHRIVGLLGFDLTPAQAADLFEQWDEDGSGLIEEDEFLGLMHQVLAQELKAWRADKHVKPITSATALVQLRRREMLDAIKRRAVETERSLARTGHAVPLARAASSLSRAATWHKLSRPSGATVDANGRPSTAPAVAPSQRNAQPSSRGSGGGSDVNDALHRESNAQARAAAYDLARRQRGLSARRKDSGARYRETLERSEDLMREHLGYDGYAAAGFARALEDLTHDWQEKLLMIDTRASLATDHRMTYNAVHDERAIEQAKKRHDKVRTVHAKFCFDEDYREQDAEARARFKTMAGSAEARQPPPAMGRAAVDARLRCWSAEPAGRGAVPPASVGHARPSGYDETARHRVHLLGTHGIPIHTSAWAAQATRREAVIRCRSLPHARRGGARPSVPSSRGALRPSSSLGSLGARVFRSPSRVSVSSASSSSPGTVLCHAFVGRHSAWRPRSPHVRS